MPIVGHRMLIFCGLSFAFVGDVKEQTGPYTFVLENASMICRTGGVSWDTLADGKEVVRHKATFRYQGTISVGPFFSWSRDWVGELPGKDHTCKNVV